MRFPDLKCSTTAISPSDKGAQSASFRTEQVLQLAGILRIFLGRWDIMRKNRVAALTWVKQIPVGKAYAMAVYLAMSQQGGEELIKIAGAASR
jgi:hypothetical protein